MAKGIDINRLLTGNPITKQGSDRDILTNLQISDILIASTFPLEEIEAFAGANSLAATIANYLPGRMENIGFSLSVPGISLSETQQRDLVGITNVLLALRPWFTDAQTRANIGNHAWLALDLIDSSDPQQTQMPTARLPEPASTTRSVNGITVTEQSSRRPTGRRAIATRLPLSFPLDWSADNVNGLVAAGVVSGVTHSLTRERSYVYRRRGNLSSYLRDGYAQQMSQYSVAANFDNGQPLRVVTEEMTLRQWLAQQLSSANNLDDVIFELIDISHALQFAGLGHIRRDSLTETELELARLNCEYRPRLESTTLQRAILPILTYESALAIALNRYGRAEFIHISTQELGARNLDIARTLAQATSQSSLGTTIGGGATPVEVIQANLKRIRDAATAFGVIETDSDSAITIHSRNLAGTDDQVQVHRDRLLAAGELPESILMRVVTRTSLGADVSENDRRQLASDVDSAWLDHWAPNFLTLARYLATRYPSIADYVNDIVINPQSAYQLSDTESAELLDSVSQSFDRLINRGVVSPAEARTVLRDHPVLGQTWSHLGDISAAN